jgi:hypothetical protein
VICITIFVLFFELGELAVGLLQTGNSSAATNRATPVRTRSPLVPFGVRGLACRSDQRKRRAPALRLRELRHIDARAVMDRLDSLCGRDRQQLFRHWFRGLQPWHHRDERLEAAQGGDAVGGLLPSQRCRDPPAQLVSRKAIRGPSRRRIRLIRSRSTGPSTRGRQDPLIRPFRCVARAIRFQP